jgi:uncharacterized protein
MILEGDAMNTITKLATVMISGFVLSNIGFAAENVALEVPGAKLFGTLEIPSGPSSNSGPFPVALIIAGSGPTDRDGNSPAGVKSDAYKLLAQGLAANGIASLRYDKRFSGQSTTTMSEADIRFETYADDAALLLEFLSKDARFNKRVIIGHSEGSLIGMLAAQRLSVAGFISLAGAGRRIDEVLLEQLKPQLSAAMLTESARVLNELKAGRTVPESKVNLPAQLTASLFRASVQPYLVSWLKYDPAQELLKLKNPSLIVQGTTDIQVKVQDAQRLADALKTKPELIEGMNHVLKLVSLENAAQQRAYTDPSLPIAPKLLERVVAFIKTL